MLGECRERAQTFDLGAPLHRRHAVVERWKHLPDHILRELREHRTHAESRRVGHALVLIGVQGNERAQQRHTVRLEGGAQLTRELLDGERRRLLSIRSRLARAGAEQLDERRQNAEPLEAWRTCRADARADAVGALTALLRRLRRLDLVEVRRQQRCHLAPERRIARAQRTAQRARHTARGTRGDARRLVAEKRQLPAEQPAEIALGERESQLSGNLEDAAGHSLGALRVGGRIVEDAIKDGEQNISLGFARHLDHAHACLEGRGPQCLHGLAKCTHERRVRLRFVGRSKQLIEQHIDGFSRRRSRTERRGVH